MLDNIFDFGSTVLFYGFMIIVLVTVCFVCVGYLVFMKKKYVAHLDNSDKPTVKEILTDNVAVIIIVGVAIATFMLIKLLSHSVWFEIKLRVCLLVGGYAFIACITSVCIYNILKIKRVIRSIAAIAQ